MTLERLGGVPEADLPATKKPAARAGIPAQVTGLITEVSTLAPPGSRVLKKKRCTDE
jgi:hypothetical protein